MASPTVINHRVGDTLPTLISGNSQPCMGVDDIKTPIDDDYLARLRVARRVNSSRAPNDDPTLIDEAA